MHRTRLLLGLLVIGLAPETGHAPLQAADALIADRDVDALQADLARRRGRGEKSIEELMVNAREIRTAVMFVGRAEGTDVRFGTAFVISRRHRLVATNAHVADLMKGLG